MMPEYSTESFQCGSRYLSHQAVCGDLPELAKEVEAAIRERCDVTPHATGELMVPSGSGMIDACESFPKQNQSSGIAEAIRVTLLGARLTDDDFDAAVLRLAHAGAGWHQQVGFAKALDGDRGLRHAVLHQFGCHCLGAAHRQALVILWSA
jgi:hypothetical protein